MYYINLWNIYVVGLGFVWSDNELVRLMLVVYEMQCEICDCDIYLCYGVFSFFNFGVYDVDD